MACQNTAAYKKRHSWTSPPLTRLALQT